MGINDIKKGSTITVNNGDKDSFIGVVESVNSNYEGDVEMRVYNQDAGEHITIYLYIKS